jgi:signal peptidase II
MSRGDIVCGGYALSLLIVFLDQWSKAAVQAALVPGVSHPVLPHLSLWLQYNAGSAYGFLSQAGGWQRIALSAIALGVSVMLSVMLPRLMRAHRWMGYGAASLLGGAIGNLIDRVRLGHVIDFIDFHVGQWHFATFNIADASITIGAVVLCYCVVVKRQSL